MRRIGELNPKILVEAVQEKVAASNVDALLEGVTVVVDGSDNFATRYCVADAAARRGVPYVYGAVFRFEGQVAVFDPARDPTLPCYRCLFPEAPPPELAPNCSEAGVLGVLPGVVGTLQATEALKAILGIGRLLDRSVLHIDALTMQFRELRLPRDPSCQH